MANASDYWVDDTVITGTMDSPQEVFYSMLSDYDGSQVPGYFNVGLAIFAGAPDGDVDIVITEKGNTSFKVAKSGLDASSGAVQCGFVITGEYDPFYIIVLRES